MGASTRDPGGRPVGHAARRVLGGLAIGAIGVTLALPAAVAETTGIREARPYKPGEWNYLKDCAGCHGVRGEAERAMPRMEGFVGTFLCTADARAYVVRLPNIAFSTLSDRDLADMVNYVVFDLGGDSVPKNATPYSPAEVAVLRRQPLKNRDLMELRAEVLGPALEACAAG